MKKQHGILKGIYVAGYREQKDINGKEMKWARVTIMVGGSAIEFPCDIEIYDKFYALSKFGDEIEAGLFFRVQKEKGLTVLVVS